MHDCLSLQRLFHTLPKWRGINLHGPDENTVLLWWYRATLWCVCVFEGIVPNRMLSQTKTMSFFILMHWHWAWCKLVHTLHSLLCLYWKKCRCFWAVLKITPPQLCLLIKHSLKTAPYFVWHINCLSFRHYIVIHSTEATCFPSLLSIKRTWTV